MGLDAGVVERCCQQTPTLARIYLETLMAERADLYSRVLPSGLPIPIGIDPFPVDDNIPGDEGIS